jgi:glycosyltransferase involved in cell wall biosynthesis
VKVLLITPNLDNNSLGRTYCLWLLIRAAGWQAEVVSVTGDRVWAPLAGTEFARACRRVSLGATGDVPAELADAARRSDLLLAVKPVENSFGTALRLAPATRRPLLLDIDDPDIEVRTEWLPWYERAARSLLTTRYRRLRRLKRAAVGTPRLVGNPCLQEMYGGTLVPHVRDVPERPAPRPTRPDGTTVVRFVGSVRPHKGVDVLREAVASLAPEGYRLEVTAAAPADPRPWERWLGTTTLEEGRSLVATSDVVAVPSLPGSWSPAQLPVKIVDAMAAGVPVVASDVGPVAWALGRHGLLVRPGDVADLTRGLQRLRDPVRRAQVGEGLRQRAAAEFSVAAVVDRFRDGVKEAVRATSVG